MIKWQEFRYQGAVKVFWVLTLLILATVGSWEYLSHFDYDLYQSLSDAFRSGQLALLEKAHQIDLFDLSPRGENVYISWGFPPALFYAFLDILASIFGGGVFPKALALFLVLILHLWLILEILIKQEKKVWYAFLYTGVYLFSYPVFTVLNTKIQIYQTSILYAITFQLLSIYLIIRYTEKQTLFLMIMALLFSGMAFLTRPIYLAYLVLTTLWFACLNRCFKNRGIAFSILFFFIVIQLGYNGLRFGDITDFGINIKYQHLWDDYIFDYGVVAMSFILYVKRIFFALSCMLGIPFEAPSVGGFPFHECRQQMDFFFSLNFLFLGVFLLPFRKWWSEKSPHLITLTGVVSVGIYYLLFNQKYDLRYALDLYPFLFIIFFLAFSRGADERESKAWPWLKIIVIPGIIFLHTAFTESNLPRAEFSAQKYQIAATKDGYPAQNVECQNIPEIKSWDDIPNAQTRNHILGIFRLQDECQMLFFSGITHRVVPGNSCTLSLFGKKERDCQSIQIYIDGRTQGRMLAGETGECRFKLPVVEQESLMIHFHLTDIKYSIQAEIDLRKNSERANFFKSVVNCE